MARFVGRLVVEQEEGWWVLRQPLRYEESQVACCPLEVPAEFRTDFASTPRLLWNLYPPHDHRYSRAAVLHDRLYELHTLTRAAADAVFREAMQVTGTRRLRAWAMWAAVRCFGRSAYRTGPVRQAERRAAYLCRVLGPPPA